MAICVKDQSNASLRKDTRYQNTAEGKKGDREREGQKDRSLTCQHIGTSLISPLLMATTERVLLATSFGDVEKGHVCCHRFRSKFEKSEKEAGQRQGLRNMTALLNFVGLFCFDHWFAIHYSLVSIFYRHYLISLSSFVEVLLRTSPLSGEVE